MKKSEPKYLIYKRTFLVLLAMYFALMIGFSVVLLIQQFKIEGLNFGSKAGHINQEVNLVLQDHIDEEDQIKDIAKLKRELVYDFTHCWGMQVALYSSDFERLMNTKEGWVCSFTEYKEENVDYTGYAYMNPRDWFNEEEVQELEDYLNTERKAKKKGELWNYSVTIKGFWLDEEVIIPDKIEVIPMYAHGFDEYGNVYSGSGDCSEKIIFQSNYNNEKELPYYSHGSIQTMTATGNKQNELRELVLDREKLIKTSKEYFVSVERSNLLTYHCYYAIPYHNHVTCIEGECYSEFWTVCASEFNLLQDSWKTLLIVWLATLVPFFLAGWILSARTVRMYQGKNECDKVE